MKIIIEGDFTHSQDIGIGDIIKVLSIDTTFHYGIIIETDEGYNAIDLKDGRCFFESFFESVEDLLTAVLEIWGDVSYVKSNNVELKINNNFIKMK